MQRRSMVGAMAAITVAGALLAGCGSWKRVGASEPAPEASEQLTQLLDLPSYFRRLGRLAAGEPLPFVGTVGFLAGAGDTVLTTVALSLENRSLNFQKEGNGFVGRFRVELAFTRPDQPGAQPVQVTRDESVRVSSFQETQRGEESIFFQQNFKLLPGRYHVKATLRDPGSGNTATAERDLVAPAFPAGSTTSPLLVYQAKARDRAGDVPEVVLNSRGVVAYGADTLLALVEGYRFPRAAMVPFEVRTATDSVIHRDSLPFRGGQEVETQVIRLAPDSVALGELKLVIGSGDAAKETSALISFSQAWVVTNFDEMLTLLRYYGHENWLDSLRRAPPARRDDTWRAFWKATDPDPSTPENEGINRYLARVSFANQRFRTEGTPGWRTDRGEVFITLGEPDETFDASALGQGQGRVIRWNYIDLRLSLLFVDETGFGRFRLTPATRAEFDRVVRRERGRADQ